jgi:hypothetical protein
MYSLTHAKSFKPSSCFFSCRYQTENQKIYSDGRHVFILHSTKNNYFSKSCTFFEDGDLVPYTISKPSIKLN